MQPRCLKENHKYKYNKNTSNKDLWRKNKEVQNTACLLFTKYTHNVM